MLPNHTLVVESLSFSFPASTRPLFSKLDFQCASGWTGICGANGIGKSTLLLLISGELPCQEGHIHLPGPHIYCPQRTDRVNSDIEDFFYDFDAPALSLRSRLGIEEEWIDRWDSLSHGERKRIQIATALWREPSVLLLDEPSNHIDADTTELLLQAIRSFQGIGLIVTHNRHMLDSVCHQCLWLSAEGAQLRKGGYSQGKASHEKEILSREREIKALKKAESKLSRTASVHRENASNADRRLSKRGIALKDHDAKDKINAARVSGMDAIDGKRLNQLEGRLSQLQERKKAIQVEKQYRSGIKLEARKFHRNSCFNSSPDSLPLGDTGRVLHLPQLILRPDDRIALSGPNGSGKSTLIRHLLQQATITGDDLLYLPQEMSQSDSEQRLGEIKKLGKEALGRLLQVVRRLGSDPKRILESSTPSPGELRKLLIAWGIMKNPAFLILDEPTNHLDLPSIECLESCLKEAQCGLLLVSHDDAFLKALTRTRWTLRSDGFDSKMTIE